MSERTDALIAAREKTHGNYKGQAMLAQALKNTMLKSANADELLATHKEALDMIASKIARILSGDPYCADHWLDIAGYAQLAATDCRN